MRKYWWIAVAALIADQLSKWGARHLTQPVTLIPGVIGLTYAENTGMAFSLLSGQPWLLGILSVILITGGALVLRRYPLGRWSRTAAMLMLGGAAGNMIDRFATGYVVDMIEVLAFRFAIFNVADACLTVGCCLMAASLLFKPDEWSEKHGRTEGDPV
ncbi:MAG: signal peptidase II [Alistipes sp.]|nr:signal peptidase II [Alistipes sp.]MBR4082147.1 signal peptidase II [Clostridia bacterium]